MHIYINLYVYTWDSNVFWIYKRKHQQVSISYSSSVSSIPLLFYQLLPFLEKNVPFPIFCRKKRTPINIPFVKWGKCSYD